MTPPDEGPSGADPAAAQAPTGDDRATPARSAPDWRPLTETLTRELHQRIAEAGGDPAKFEGTWDALAAAYGPRGAYGVVRLRAAQILDLELDPDLSDKLALLAQSRHNFLPESTTHTAIPALPLAGEEYQSGRRLLDAAPGPGANGGGE
jgi:hypothetical protein